MHHYVVMLNYVLGLFVYVCVSTQLASHLTHPPMAKPMLTVQDVIDNHLRIKMRRDEYDYAKSVLPEEFLQQIDIVDQYELQHYRNHFNQSFGYSVSRNDWEFLNLQQLRLPAPRFHLSDICFGTLFNILPVQKDLFFETWLSHYIHMHSSTGLTIVYKNIAFQQARTMGLVEIMQGNLAIEPLSLKYFEKPFTYLLLIILSAIIVFLFELSWAEDA